MKKHEKTRMPNSSQLRAQGMEQVDKAICEVHGGYVAVADKLGWLHPLANPVARPKKSMQEGGKKLRPVGMDEEGRTSSRVQRTVNKENAVRASSHAVRPLWGGRAFAQTIPASKDVAFFEDLRNVRLTVEEVARQHTGAGVSSKSVLRWMPTERQLEDHGLQDALLAINIYHGGMHSCARKLGLRIQGPATRASWNTA